MTYNNSGNLYELKDTDYKPSLFPRGVIYRLKINNFGGFQINYNVTNTIDYKIISINEQDYTKYNTDKMQVHIMMQQIIVVIQQIMILQ